MILLGVALEVCATMAGTVGKQLLRYSKLVELSGKESLGRMCLAVGLVLNVAGGPVLEIAAFGQAPQTILAPLNGLDVLWNIMLVPYTLGENPSLTQIMGCLLIVGGTALTAIGGPHTEQPYTLDTMRERLLTLSALTYILVEGLVIILGLLFMRRRPQGDRARGFVLGCVAGGIGGNLFFMKATASLISVTVSNGPLEVWQVWTESPLPVLVAASAGMIAVASAVLLAGAMREFEATMMVATYEGAFVISGCASGVAVLGELDVVSPHRRMLYAVGVFIAVGGVLAAQHQEPVTRHSVTPMEIRASMNSLCTQSHSMAASRASLLQVHEQESQR